MAQRIRRLRVDYISLVDRPANRKPIVYKSASGRRAKVTIGFSHVRKDAKEGLIYGVVYEPNVVDTQGDWTDAATIKRAAHEFVASKKVAMVDMMHDEQAGKGVVVESFIKNGDHPEFPNVNDGAWCVVIKVAEEMKSKMDLIGGLSLQGTAAYSAEDLRTANADKRSRMSGHPALSPGAVTKFSKPLAKAVFTDADDEDTDNDEAVARFVPLEA